MSLHDSPETLLITVTGTDRPGVTSAVLETLAQSGVAVVDAEQILIRGRLVLGVLVTAPRDTKRLRAAVTRTVEALGMSVDIERGSGDNRRRSQDRAHVTVIGSPLKASAMASIAGRIADCGGNIDRIERMARYPVTAIEPARLRRGARPAAHAARRRRRPPRHRRRGPGREHAAPRRAADRDGRRLHAHPGRGDRDARRARRLRRGGRRGHRAGDARRDSTSSSRCGRG
ncbi:ACT domain-containing protein [Nocardioides convexus]|uniref:ACT domain-containing protein n=1 Tax=Nocardioides convexus TaxID=2712224 RepID=UPI0031010366